MKAMWLGLLIALASPVLAQDSDDQCLGVNAFAQRNFDTVERLRRAWLDAPYRSEAKCTYLCQLREVRNQVLTRYGYSGSWDCETAAVGVWTMVDIAQKPWCRCTKPGP